MKTSIDHVSNKNQDEVQEFNSVKVADSPENVKEEIQQENKPSYEQMESEFAGMKREIDELKMKVERLKMKEKFAEMMEVDSMQEAKGVSYPMLALLVIAFVLGAYINSYFTKPSK